jgi:hypothetical protein
MQTKGSWKIPTTLHDMKLRADNIGGEIKQADVNIVEAKKRRDQAKEALALAERGVTACEEIAADRRAERDALASALYSHTKGLGETPPTTTPPTTPGLGSGATVATETVGF